MKTRAKIVRTQMKGMVTIPAEFREKLHINENSLLEAKMIKNGVAFLKIEIAVNKNARQEEVELYSAQTVRDFLEDDKLDEKTAKKLHKLFR